jgi:hypothetical protein
MQLHEALRDAPSYLRNAQDIAPRKPINVDTLYMWDNQVAAIDAFLAETEEFAAQDPSLATTRKELFGLRKQIQNNVLEFELKQENQELPPDPTEEEVVAEMTEYARDLQKTLMILQKIKFKKRADFERVEEPLQELAAFLVETEPLKGKNPELDKYRAEVKRVRAEIDNKTRDYLKDLRSKEAEEPDED